MKLKQLTREQAKRLAKAHLDRHIALAKELDDRNIKIQNGLYYYAERFFWLDKLNSPVEQMKNYAVKYVEEFTKIIDSNESIVNDYLSKL